MSIAYRTWEIERYVKPYINESGRLESENMTRYPGAESRFIEEEGIAFFAHVLRRVSDRLVAGFEEWYKEIGIDVPVRTASTMRVLHRLGPLPVTVIATHIDQSHPLVITRVRQLEKLKFATAVGDQSDGRIRLVALTERGSKAAARMVAADRVIEEAYRNLFREADAECFDALWRIETACRAKGMGQRLREAGKVLGSDQGQ